MKLTRCLLAVLALHCLASGLAAANPLSVNYTEELLRLSKAAHIKAYLSTEQQQPCQNFYSLACGNWPRLHSAKLHRRSTNYLDELQELFIKKSIDLLNTTTRGVDTSAERLLKIFYGSCQSQSSNRSAALRTLLQIADFQGGWPELREPEWYENEYDWLEVVAMLRRRLGLDVLIGLDIVVDDYNEHLYRIKVGAPQQLLTNRQLYESAERRQRYEQSIGQKLTTYLPQQSQQWHREIAAQVLQIEQQLAKGLPQQPTALDYTERTLNQINTAYGSFVDINRYQQLVFNNNIYMSLYESPPGYLSNLVEVIQKTPKLHLANYTIWRTLDFLDQADRPGTWCAELVRKYFPEQLESLFQRNFNNMPLINEVQSTWADVKRVFHEDLQASTDLHWMTLDTRQKAIGKLHALQLQFPNHDNNQLIRQMHSLNLQPYQFYPNLANVLQWHTLRQLSQISEHPKLPTGVYELPHYEQSINKIVIPMAFLQPRFFWDPAYPTALKYGTIGILLAQQMLLGFDNVGRYHDREGFKSNWWDLATHSAFGERKQCFEAELQKDNEVLAAYANLLDFIIIDTGALNIAYRAYTKWQKNLSDAPKIKQQEMLPLLDYTPQQLFFLAHAQLYCSDSEDSLQDFDEYRLNTALRYSKEFAKTFTCVDRQTNCSLW